MSYAAVFDLDGTLIDTPRAIVETFTAALAAIGAPAQAPSAIRSTIGLPLDQAFGKLLGAPPDPPRVVRGAAAYQTVFRRDVLPRAAELVFSGVADGLAALRARSVTLAVATSKFKANAEAILRSAGLRHHFAMVVGADEVTRPKPDPEVGLMILRSLGIAPEHAVMVGDTTHDLLMADAAGMRSIAVTYGVHGYEELLSAGPTWLADTFDEVLMHLLQGVPQG